MIVTLQQPSTEYTCIFDHVHSLTSPTSQCCDNTLTLHSSSEYQDSASSQNQRSLCWQHINALVLANSPTHIWILWGQSVTLVGLRPYFADETLFFKMVMHDRKKQGVKLYVDLYITWPKLNQKGKAGFTHREIGAHPSRFCAILIFCWRFMDLPSHVWHKLHNFWCKRHVHWLHTIVF